MLILRHDMLIGRCSRNLSGYQEANTQNQTKHKQNAKQNLTRPVPGTKATIPFSRSLGLNSRTLKDCALDRTLETGIANLPCDHSYRQIPVKL